MAAKPKSPATRTGNPSKKKFELNKVDVLPEAPAYLSEAAAAHFDEIIVQGGGLYDVDSVEVIGRYVNLHEQFVQVSEEISKQGMMVMGSQGQMVANPLLRIQGDLSKQLKSLEESLIRTPEAKMRVGWQAVAEEVDPFDQMLEEG
jgi:P27 family predicted phage terminase small subunit